MSSLTSEISRNTKLELFTRDGVVALYQEKGSKHQDQLSQSHSAARKTPLIHTGGAERATHGTSLVLWDKFGKKNARKRNKILQKRRKKPPSLFFTSTTLYLTATTIFLLGCQLSFGERISHKEGCYVFPSSTCSQRKPRSGSRIETPVCSKTLTSAERPGHYYARLRLVPDGLSSTAFASVIVPNH